MAKLIIYEEINGADTVYETYFLQENRVTIGSADDNQLILESPDVDPMHASLELRENHHWYLQDLGGFGGTGVNGQLIEGPFMLRHNDVIVVGFVRMRFQTDDERGVTAEIPVSELAAAPADASPPASPAAQPSGRIWFAGLAFATAAVIFVILLLFLAGHILGILNILDLMPGG